MCACCRLANLASVTCDVNAVCSGAACVCKTNYYGDGFTCSRTMPAIVTRPPMRCS